MIFETTRDKGVPSSQCQRGTVASATVSLEHWAACSLGHRPSPLGYRQFVYYSGCHDLLFCQKQAPFSGKKCPVHLGHVGFKEKKKITLIAGNSSPHWVSAGHAGEPSPQAAQSPLSQQQLCCVNSIETGSRFCVFFLSSIKYTLCLLNTLGLVAFKRGYKVGWVEKVRSGRVGEEWVVQNSKRTSNWGERSPERRTKHCRSPLHKDLVVLPQTVSPDLPSRSLPAWPAPSPGRDPEVSFSLSCTNVSKMIRYPPPNGARNRQWEEAWGSLLTKVYKPSPISF